MDEKSEEKENTMTGKKPDAVSDKRPKAGAPAFYLGTEPRKLPERKVAAKPEKDGDTAAVLLCVILVHHLVTGDQRIHFGKTKLERWSDEIGELEEEHGELEAKKAELERDIKTLEEEFRKLDEK